MKHRPLGRTGLTVSEICLGTMTWGSQNTQAEAHRQMDCALEKRVTFFDTAEMYPTTPLAKETVGRTEELVGSWFAARGRRDEVVLATKITGEGSPLARTHGLQPAEMAIAFCLARPFMTSVIVGATSLDQLELAIGATDVTLSGEVMEGIAALHRRWPLPF